MSGAWNKSSGISRMALKNWRRVSVGIAPGRASSRDAAPLRTSLSLSNILRGFVTRDRLRILPSEFYQFKQLVELFSDVNTTILRSQIKRIPPWGECTMYSNKLSLSTCQSYTYGVQTNPILLKFAQPVSPIHQKSRAIFGPSGDQSSNCIARGHVSCVLERVKIDK